MCVFEASRQTIKKRRAGQSIGDDTQSRQALDKIANRSINGVDVALGVFDWTFLFMIM